MEESKRSFGIKKMEEIGEDDEDDLFTDDDDDLFGIANMEPVKGNVEPVKGNVKPVQHEDKDK